MQGSFLPLLMKDDIDVNIAYILAFAETSNTKEKLRKLLKYSI
jgi:hypothetical protein